MHAGIRPAEALLAIWAECLNLPARYAAWPARVPQLLEFRDSTKVGTEPSRICSYCRLQSRFPPSVSFSKFAISSLIRTITANLTAKNSEFSRKRQARHKDGGLRT